MKKVDLLYFESGMVVGACRAGRSVWETAELVGTQQSLGFTGNSLKKRKSSEQQNALLMPEIRGE